METQSENKTIAKNTVFLYIRMLIILFVTLYTSRVILQALGIDDYGLYQTVGGIVGFLTFINSALSGATSRFITYALGTGDGGRLKKTFSTTFTTHLIIGVLIIFVSETVGLWYVNNKMIIPEERFGAAIAVFHVSIITAFVSIMQVPFNAAVIAHERMSVFAYVGIVEAISKLGIIFLLSVGGIDRLVLYSILLFLVHVGIFAYYLLYCKEKFAETAFSIKIDRKLFKEIFSFSGWSLFANGSIALSNQGILLLLNLFFTPAVVAARSISLQVNSVANQFVQNFRTAANPQIVKRYAAGDLQGSKNLLLESTKYSYYLMLLIALPLFFLADPLLHLWLVEVPNYTVVFLQLVVIQSLFQVFDSSFYTALYAKGRIRENAILSPLTGFLCFPIVYLLFKSGCSPLALSWAYLICYALLGLVIKPVLINKICDYTWKELLGVYWICLIVTFAAIPIPLMLYYMLGVETLSSNAIILFASVLFVVLAVWLLGITPTMRHQLFQLLRSRVLFMLRRCIF